MIYIYGDSHARMNFAGLDLPHCNFSCNSITMHRVGRDQEIIGFQPQHNAEDSVFVCVYGEIDCRCHIQRQINAGRVGDQVIQELADQFMKATQVFSVYSKVIVCSVTPALRRSDFESVHGEITHAFPFVGTDEQRVEYTAKLNEKLEQACHQHGYTFFNFSPHYQREDGTLKYELSDQNSHIRENGLILKLFKELLQ